MGVTDPTSPQFKGGPHGWDGTQWRKLPLVWGYFDIYGEQKSELNAAAGANTLNGTAVPAGEIWVVQAFAARDSISDPASIQLYIFVNSVAIPVEQVATPGAGVWLMWQGGVTMKEGDYVRAYFAGCTLNDDLYLVAGGYKMAITE